MPGFFALRIPALLIVAHFLSEETYLVTPNELGKYLHKEAFIFVRIVYSPTSIICLLEELDDFDLGSSD